MAHVSQVQAELTKPKPNSPDTRKNENKIGLGYIMSEPLVKMKS